MRIRIRKEQPKKRRIQEVAVVLFSKYGFDGVSVKDIAKAADVNVAMVSYYFGGKYELYKEIIDNFFKTQSEFLKNLISVKDFEKLSHVERVYEFEKVLESFIDFFYGEVSPNLLEFLVKEHNKIEEAPWIKYLRDLMGILLNLPNTSQFVIFCVTALISLVYSGHVFFDDFRKLLGKDLESVRTKLKVIVSVLIQRIFVDINALVSADLVKMFERRG